MIITTLPFTVVVALLLNSAEAEPCALNAADEIAVAAFLEQRLPFSGIAQVIERVLERMPRMSLRVIEDVASADGEARRLAKEEIDRQNQRAAAAG